MTIAPARQHALESSPAAPVIEVEDLKKHFPVKKGLLRRTVGQVLALDGVSFAIPRGETLGLVGESGCGKSTLARTVLRLIEPTAGAIKVGGRDITHLRKRELRPYRREMQIIFQDPFSSLNPRMSAGDIVGEPLQIHGMAPQQRRQRVAELFELVGLAPAQMASFPHQFSGGQRQRICIARALAMDPEILVADEPVSALDVSVQAQVLDLIDDVRKRFNLAVLFITHDLRVAAQVCDRIAVMHQGAVVEEGPTTQVFGAPQHAYTRALLDAAPGRHMALGQLAMA